MGWGWGEGDSCAPRSGTVSPACCSLRPSPFGIWPDGEALLQGALSRKAFPSGGPGEPDPHYRVQLPTSLHPCPPQALRRASTAPCWLCTCHPTSLALDTKGIWFRDDLSPPCWAINQCPQLSSLPRKPSLTPAGQKLQGGPLPLPAPSPSLSKNTPLWTLSWFLWHMLWRL